MTTPAPKKNFIQNSLDVFHEFPGQFWIVVLATFIDRLGGAMLFPFFTLYMTKKFEIGMTEVGVMFGLYSVSGVASSVIGGALTDRLGRKGLLLFGLVMSALVALLMGFIDQLALFFVVTLLVGMLADVGGPAQQALVADLLPEEKRAQGFGILRVAFNLSVAIGPVLGGLLATQSYMYLFIADAITSSITAILVYFTLKETHKPKQVEGEAPETMIQTFTGYRKVLKDTAFLWYMVASMLLVLVYMQMNTTLAVYLRDNHGVSVQQFGYILSLNAAMVVLFQFPITRWVSRYRPLLVMAAGTLLYAFGFGMYGVVGLFAMFLLAMVIITIGEMMVAPVGQAIVTSLAPEDMRGRYMATYGFSWIVPATFGPVLAGMVLDSTNPNLLWYMAGVIGVLAAAGFYLMEMRVTRARWGAVDERLHIMEQLEQGKLSAEQASQMLASVNEGSWARLAPPAPAAGRRQMRIRVSDLVSGDMKVDLSLPMGVVNTVLYMGGHFSTALQSFEMDGLKELVSLSAADENRQQLETSRERVEVSIEQGEEAKHDSSEG